MDKPTQAARQIATDIEAMIKLARENQLDTLLYVLETAKIEALRALARPKPVA